MPRSWIGRLLQRDLLSQRWAYYVISRRFSALAFARQRPFVTSVLMAARTADQLAHNLKGLDVTLSKELMKEIDAIHDAHPNPK